MITCLFTVVIRRDCRSLFYLTRVSLKQFVSSAEKGSTLALCRNERDLKLPKSESNMCDILDAIFSKANHFSIDEQTCEGLLERFRSKLGLVAESVEKLPETYMKASTYDIINELYNTIHRIQLNDSVDLCVQMVNAVENKYLPHLKSEFQAIIENMHLIKSTWEMCHSQYGNNFNNAPDNGSEEMMEALTSTLFLSNSFLKVVNDTFENITNRNGRRGGGAEHFKLDSSLIAIATTELLPSENCPVDFPIRSDTCDLETGDISQETWSTDDVIDAFPIESMTGCESEILDIALETIAESLSESHINSDVLCQNESQVDTARLEQDNYNCVQTVPSCGEDELAQLLTNYSQNEQNARSFSGQNELAANNTKSDKGHSFNSDNKNCYDEKNSNFSDFEVNYCHSRTIDSSIFSNAFSKNPKVLEDKSLGYSLKEGSAPEGLVNLPPEFLSHFHPKTKEGVFDAIAKVFAYLQEESKWARKLSRRNKMYAGHSSSRKSKLPRPNMSFEVQIFVKLGILPWDLKNRECKPSDDTHCQIKIPEDIKTAILRYRSWYPTMHDKLYCFENHSKYLFDLELFGCWECIRKYYNEIYKWANKNGFVLREIRMY